MQKCDGTDRDDDGVLPGDPVAAQTRQRVFISGRRGGQGCRSPASGPARRRSGTSSRGQLVTLFLHFVPKYLHMTPPARIVVSQLYAGSVNPVGAPRAIFDDAVGVNDVGAPRAIFDDAVGVNVVGAPRAIFDVPPAGRALPISFFQLQINQNPPRRRIIVQ